MINTDIVNFVSSPWWVGVIWWYDTYCGVKTSSHCLNLFQSSALSWVLTNLWVTKHPMTWMTSDIRWNLNIDKLEWASVTSKTSNAVETSFDLTQTFWLWLKETTMFSDVIQMLTDPRVTSHNISDVDIQILTDLRMFSDHTFSQDLNIDWSESDDDVIRRNFCRWTWPLNIWSLRCLDRPELLGETENTKDLSKKLNPYHHQ